MIDIQTLIGQSRMTIRDTLILSIDGHGGSGKSTLANNLAELLNAEVIHTDDFASMEKPRNWWPDVLESVFLPIESGATVLNYERSKWWANHSPSPVKNQKVTNVMIFEGVGSSQLTLRKYLGLSIFVDTPVSICLQRGIARDRKNNAGSEEEITKHWKQWIQEESSYFESDKPEKYAEITVDGTVPFNHQVVGLEQLK